MVRAAGVTALLVAWLLWCGGCTERTLAVNPLYGSDGGGPGGGDGGGGDSVQKMGDPCPALRGFTCIAPFACWKTCGPARSGFRNCACDISGTLQCTDACLYEAGQNTSCFALSDPVPSCPPNPADAATQLPQGTAPCHHDPCRPCGSSTDAGYLDSSGTPRAGYCVCVPNPDTGLSVYSCASVVDWPPQ